MATQTPLKRILRDEGRLQSWLAARAGIRQDTLSRIVNGRDCDEVTQSKIAAALGREVAEIFPAVALPDADAA